LSLETGEQKILIENGRQSRYVETGHLIYEQAPTGNLMAVSFDLASLEVTSDPVPILQGVRRHLVAYVEYAISDNGTLVYVPGGATTFHQHSLVWVDRDGKETPVTQEKKDYRVPRISPDGKLISVTVGDPATTQLWIYDLEAESLSRLTFEEERSGSSVWSPDSKWLIFQSGREDEGGLVRQPADRSLPQERLTSTRETGGRQMPNSWSSDGRFVAFNHSNPLTGTHDIGILRIGGDGEPEYLVASDANECCPKFSPDGNWLVYVSDESGRNQVYVRPFPGPEVKWLISEEGVGGGQPVWSPDGRELFYRSGNKTLVVSIQTRGQTLTAGSPQVLFEGQYVNHSIPAGFQYYDISPDGNRFLMLKEITPETTQINVVLNWFEELKRLVPTP
jgi:serine/threonine-protein kinase